MAREIVDHVRHIADELSAGTDAKWAHEWHENNCHLWDAEEGESMEEHLDWCDERPSAYDYLTDVLDIEYVVSSSREYLGARILVAFGGPNIWINTRNEQVEGHWWGDSATESFDDNLGLDDVLAEMWEMGS